MDNRLGMHETSAIKVIQGNWGWFLALGILLVSLGVIAISAAVYTSFLTMFLIGILLIAGGITKLIYSFSARQWQGFLLSLLSGLLYGVVGVLILVKPLPALAALTLIIGSLFLVSGLFKISASLVWRFEQWGWVLLSGLISLLLGILILADWPAASLWVIGLFLGIDMVFYGWSWILLALGARSWER